MSVIFGITASPSFHWVQQKHLTTATTLGEDLVHSKLHILDYRYCVPFSCMLPVVITLHSALSNQSPVRHVVFVNYQVHCGVPSIEWNGHISGQIHFRHRLIQLASCLIACIAQSNGGCEL